MHPALALSWLLLLGVSWLTPIQARALGWRVPDACPDAYAARRALLTQGVPAHAIDSAEVEIQATATGQLEARVKLESHAPDRALYADNCRALTDAVLLVISLGTRQLAPAPSRARDASPGRLALSASALLEVGALPHPGLGTGAALGGALGRGRVDLYGGYWLAQTDLLRATPEGKARYGFYALGARGCVSLTGTHTRRPRWPNLGPCAGVEFGSMSGQTSKLELVGRARGTWGAALLGLMFAPGPWRRITPVLQLDMTVPFLRPVFDVQGLGAVHRTGPVTLRVALGLRVELVH